MATLRRDLSGAIVATGPRSCSQHIVDMSTDYDLKPEHLVMLCDAVLSGDLEPDDLETIGFCLVASDHFGWNDDTPPGDVIGQTVHDWSAPEVNYRMTRDTVRKFRERLVTGSDLFIRDDVSKQTEASPPAGDKP